MRATLDTIATVVIIVAAVAVAAVNIRHWLTTDMSKRVDLDRRPVHVDGWRGILSYGTAMGDLDAPAVVVEFADLECPFCRRFHHAIEEASEHFGTKLTRVFVHYPLPRHRFSWPAARAAECALQEDRFGDFIDIVFSKQDSLGLKTWSSYAQEAGVADTITFNECTTTSVHDSKIHRGIAIGDSIGVTGTPTILINGWRYPIAPYGNLIGEIEGRIRQDGISLEEGNPLEE